MGQLKVFIHSLKIVETCLRRCVHRLERFPDTFVKFGRWGAGLKMWPAQEQEFFDCHKRSRTMLATAASKRRLSQLLNDSFVHWNAVVLRYAERDFKGWSVDGIEEDWPLTYDELAPYYERIEEMIGVWPRRRARDSSSRKTLFASASMAVQRTHFAPRYEEH